MSSLNLQQHRFDKCTPPIGHISKAYVKASDVIFKTKVEIDQFMPTSMCYQNQACLLPTMVVKMASIEDGGGPNKTKN
jgi:hypothetical protein